MTSAWLQWYEVNAYGSTGGLRGRKHLLYEGGIRVPALVRMPGITQPGSSSDALVIGNDWFNTLLAQADVNIPADRAIDGMDITAALAGSTSQPPRQVLWALDSVSELEFAYRSGDWKLLLDRTHTPRELYYLASDPLEMFNRVADEPSRVANMRKAFLSTLENIVNDPITQ